MMPTPTNPFLCSPNPNPPKKHRKQDQTQMQTQTQMQKRENPFLSNRNNGAPNQFQQFQHQQFQPKDGQSQSQSPPSFEESFPSLLSKHPPIAPPTKLNFKSAIQTGQQDPQSMTQSQHQPSGQSQHQPSGQSQQHQPSGQSPPALLRGNMFLYPQMRQHPRAIDDYNDANDDDNDHDTMHRDAYDSAYVKYYND